MPQRSVQTRAHVRSRRQLCSCVRQYGSNSVWLMGVIDKVKYALVKALTMGCSKSTQHGPRFAVATLPRLGSRGYYLFQFKMCPRRGDRGLPRSGVYALQAANRRLLERTNKRPVIQPPAADQWRGIGPGPRGPWPASPSPDSPGKRPEGAQTRGPCRALTRSYACRNS